jgi:predicted transcriptional regulator YdeE
MAEPGTEFTDQGISITPRVADKPGMVVAGFAFNPEADGWDHVPTAFLALCRRLPAIFATALPGVAYGVIYNSTDNRRPPDTYLAGVQVTSSADLPEGTTVLAVPPGTYAVFTIRGSLGKMGAAYGYIDGCWLKDNSDWAPDPDAATKPIEVYDERFVPGPASQFEIWTPIRRKPPASA